MARCRLTGVAGQKIESIYEYSVLRFAEAQAGDYFLGLHDLFELLANNPSWVKRGRTSEKVCGDFSREPTSFSIVRCRMAFSFSTSRA